MTKLIEIKTAPDGVLLRMEKATGGLHLASINKTDDCVASLKTINEGLGVLGEQPLSAQDESDVCAQHAVLA